MEQRTRILLVEDDKVDRMAFERFVKREGLPYDCATAGSVAEARDVLGGARFDAVLIDYLLGDGTAFDLLGEIKDSPAIVITGSGDEEIAVQAMKAGAYDYLVKDSEGNYLKTVPVTVEGAIHRKRDEEELRRYREQLEVLVEERTAELTRANERLVAEIAERKRVEETLRESEERYRHLVMAANAAMFAVDFDGVFLFMNSIAAQQLGGQPEDFIGKTMGDVFPPEVAELQVAGVREIIHSGQGRVQESETTMQDERRWYRTHGQPLCDDAGNIYAAMFIGTDITERKQAAEALRERERILNATGRMGKIGGWEHDLATGKAVWTQALYDIIEIPYDQEPPGVNEHISYYPPQGQEILEQAYNQAVKNGTPFDLELQVYTSKKKLIWCRAQGKPVYKNGKCVAMRGTFQDITERVRAEEALRESERRYRLLAENVTDVIWTMDMNLQSIYTSPSVMRLRGYSAEEAMAQTLEEALTPASFEVAAKAFEEELAIESTPQKDLFRTRALELEVIRKDGSTVWTEVRITVLRDPDGRPVGILGVTRDITGRMRMEKELRQQERLAAVGQLAGGIAHDFNNLLTTIMLYAQMGLGKKGDLAPDLTRAFETILDESRQAAKLVQQVLDFSRRSPMETHPVDLKSFIKEAVRVLQRTIPESISLLLEVEPGEYVADADPTRIQQVLMNLVVNARDVMPEGGVLRIDLSRVEVSPGDEPPVAGMASGEWVCLAVTDTGAGILPEVLPHIFEPFFTTKEPGKGTGLGLAQVYGIVTQHEGHVGVETGGGARHDLPGLPPGLPGCRGGGSPERGSPGRSPREGGDHPAGGR